jgi:hypothetical protein
MLVRGDDRHRHFEEVPPPTSEFSPEAIAIHDRAVGLYREAYAAAGSEIWTPRCLPGRFSFAIGGEWPQPITHAEPS